MYTERQPTLDGFESNRSNLPEEESDSLIKETLAPGLSEALVNLTEDSTVGNEPIDDGQETQEGDVQTPQIDGWTESKITGPDLLAADAVGEYPLSAWAMISPDMSPEQIGLLAEDVERNGVIVAVDVLDGQVVDGRHREAARKKAGKAPNYNLLPEGTNIVRHLLSKHGLSGHHNENQRAVYAYKLWRQQFIDAGIDPDSSSANLRSFVSQEEITRHLNVSPRTVSSVSAVLSPRRTSSVSLKNAVECNRIKASDAEGILREPEEIQDKAVAIALRGEPKTVAAAVKRIRREMGPEPSQAGQPQLAGKLIGLHCASPSQLIGIVQPESIASIITFPSPDPSMHYLFDELAEFAAHSLKADGAMAVLTTGQHLASVMDRLKRQELQWVLEFDYRPPNAIQLRAPHRVTLRRMPILVLGKAGFRLQDGDDVIEVPTGDGSDPEKQPKARLEAGMALIMKRLTRPGQTVCDPLMLDRSHSAIAAWRTGRSFIGATDKEANLRLIRDRLARWGAFSKLGR